MSRAMGEAAFFVHIRRIQWCPVRAAYGLSHVRAPFFQT